MNKKSGFTLIEVMIVVAILAILAMIAVAAYSRYIQKSRDSAVYYLLQAAALAEMSIQMEPRELSELGFIFVASGADADQVNRLAESGFRPDPLVGFVIAQLPEVGGVRPMGFLIFAAHRAVGSQLFVYDQISASGVRPAEPGAPVLANLTATELPVFIWGAANSGDQPAALAAGTVTVDLSTCKTTAYTP